ncbi:MAG: aminotransferase class I/II-fold pyridoxal phosphate-dependent enzyme, partial [Actinomyces sp.]|nr:aminotransferase class I/II-fold pyridoxal phosphate-dependent enzyme [Actinomyces sp.]
SMAGWRFGYAAGDAEAIAALRAYQSVAFSTIFGAVQDAAEAALRGAQACVGRIAATYAHRRESVVAGLRRQGWHVAATPGTFFVWVRARGTGDGEALAERLLEEARVAVAPGEGFGEQGRGWFRLSLVHDQDTLAEALRRLEEWSRAQGRSQV